MLTFDAWLERVEAIERHDVPAPHLLVDDDALMAYAQSRKQMFAQRAERAGLDLDTINAAIADRMEDVVALALTRALAGKPLVEEMRMVIRSMALQWLLLGVLWEQQRHLPDIEL